jgi:hypothetical protein
MKVLCAYANLHPATEQALRAYVPPAWLTLVDVSGNDTGYWEEINKLWNTGEDLVIIEQDIEIHDQVLRSFIVCSAPWCTYAYDFRDSEPTVRLNESLGCAKFSPELQAGFPLSLIEGDRHWVHLDTLIVDSIKKNFKRRLNVHVHGQVEHHHSNHSPDQGCKTCKVWRAMCG